MATFSDDFGSHSTSEVANSTATTGVTGWTLNPGGASVGFVSATIVADGGVPSGKILRLADTGWGNAITLWPTSIGNVAANTETEALCCWRTASGLTSSYTVQHGAPKLRTSTTNDARHYSNGITTASGVDTLRLWYCQDGSEWASVGAAYDISATYVPGDWWWTRIHVDASGNWLWRSWKDGTAEPGSWQNASASDTTVSGGYCGVGLHRTGSAGALLDVQWFSMGTGGDSAPSPSSGAFELVPSAPIALTGTLDISGDISITSPQTFELAAIAPIALQGQIGIAGDLDYEAVIPIEQSEPIALHGSLGIYAALEIHVHRWRAPTNAPHGTLVHMVVFSGSSPTYTIRAQGTATVDADGFAQLPKDGGNPGDKAFALVHNYNDDTDTTSIYGGPCVAEIVDVS